MAKICYKPQRFNSSSQPVIVRANQILEEYNRQGFVLTLRQLYYQFVARGYLPNKLAEYKRLGNIVNDARLAGLIDWDYLEDRTRNVRFHPSWTTPASIMASAAESFRIDMWKNQDVRIEVWIEKDALVGVIEPVCNRNRVPYFACRGYVSQSEAQEAGQRILRNYKAQQRTVILHLGDHDPSGIDMTRDITDRLEMFTQSQIPVLRLALNMDQVQQYNPPPNPAKTTDSRYAQYIDIYGDESWELDALEPRAIDALIQGAIDRYRDTDRWERLLTQEDEGRKLLSVASDNWTSVKRFLKDNFEEQEDDLDTDD